LSVTGDWTVAKTPIGELSILADYYLQDSKYSQANLPAYRIGGYGLLNGRVSLTDIPMGIGNNWKLSAFAKNLTDEVYYLDYFPTVQGTAILGEPRTFGLELSVEY
jgi:iron complex outermembrane receptor protein